MLVLSFQNWNVVNVNAKRMCIQTARRSHKRNCRRNKYETAGLLLDGRGADGLAVVPTDPITMAHCVSVGPTSLPFNFQIISALSGSCNETSVAA